MSERHIDIRIGGQWRKLRIVWTLCVEAIIFLNDPEVREWYVRLSKEEGE